MIIYSHSNFGPINSSHHIFISDLGRNLTRVTTRYTKEANYRNRKTPDFNSAHKGKSREPAYLGALIQSKSIGRGAKNQRVKQADRQSDGYGGWYLELT